MSKLLLLLAVLALFYLLVQKIAYDYFSKIGFAHKAIYPFLGCVYLFACLAYLICKLAEQKHAWPFLSTHSTYRFFVFTTRNLKFYN